MERRKYPRSMNLPWSGSNSSDDVWWKDTTHFNSVEVVVTEKMDGENTTIYPDGYVHARSVDSKHHPSRSWIKSLAAGICHHLPRGWRICGENVFAWHSIFYTELPSYFLVFGIYDEEDVCLSWSMTEDFCQEIGLETVPCLWRGIWNENLVRDLWDGRGCFPTFASKIDPAERVPKFPEDFEPCEAEGYVVRAAGPFYYDEFSTKVAKYVRPHHVTTDQNWMTREMVRNLLKQD